jgi:uncharacterized cupin superfamily protein
MKLVDARTFVADRAWGSMEVLDLGENAAKVHWTDTAFRWHVNEGDELFVVLDGEVEMWHGDEAAPTVTVLRAGQVASFVDGEGHSARPIGAARVLVVERRDSE